MVTFEHKMKARYIAVQTHVLQDQRKLFYTGRAIKDTKSNIKTEVDICI